MDITYLTGDATEPQTTDRAIIAHVCNDMGAFGAGFAAAVSDRYPEAKQRFLAWADGSSPYGRPYKLGAVQWVGIGHAWRHNAGWWERWIVNMVAQVGLRSKTNPIPLNLDVLGDCLDQVGNGVQTMTAPVSIHMPRIGTGRAGSTWAEVEPLIVKHLCDRSIAVYVYDLAEPAGARVGTKKPQAAPALR